MSSFHDLPAPLTASPSHEGRGEPVSSSLARGVATDSKESLQPIRLHVARNSNELPHLNADPYLPFILHCVAIPPGAVSCNHSLGCRCLFAATSRQVDRPCEPSDEPQCVDQRSFKHWSDASY